MLADWPRRRARCGWPLRRRRSRGDEAATSDRSPETEPYGLGEAARRSPMPSRRVEQGLSDGQARARVSHIRRERPAERHEGVVPADGAAHQLARPDEHHARGGHRRECRHRPVAYRRRGRGARAVQHHQRCSPGEEGAGQRGGARGHAGPTARVLRTGEVREIPAPELVPGDVVMVEAGDLVPADGRLVRSATLEVGESALTGEATPVSKDPATVDRRRCRPGRPERTWSS